MRRLEVSSMLSYNPHAEEYEAAASRRMMDEEEMLNAASACVCATATLFAALGQSRCGGAALL